MKKLFLLLVIALGLYGCNSSLTEPETELMHMVIDNNGFITSWQDKATSKEYFPKGVKAPVMSLYKDSVYIMPKKASYDTSNNLLTLEYENGSVAKIKMEPKKSYLRLELESVEPRNNIEGVQWGPFPTTLDKWIGETVGVVRNDDFAIGVQALNIFTVEGTPTMKSHKEGRMIIDPLPGQKNPRLRVCWHDTKLPSENTSSHPLTRY